MNRCRRRQFVGNVNTHTVAFHSLDGGPVNHSVVAPAIALEAWCKLMADFFRNKMIDFYTIDDTVFEAHPGPVDMVAQPGINHDDISRGTQASESAGCPSGRGASSIYNAILAKIFMAITL